MSAQLFKTNIKHLRIISKLSQRRFCEKIDIDQRRYQHWEAGRCQPDIDNIEKISDAYNVSLDELFTKDLAKNLS